MAPANLLSPPTTIPPPLALTLSQKAPRILSNSPTSNLPWPLSLLFSRETPEAWAINENLLLTCLRTGDDHAAQQLLTRLEARFGSTNERIIALRGLYNESLARTPQELESVFEGYEKILREDPGNMSIRKRRVAVLKSLGREAEALTALTVLLENSPTDVEAWAEASELYAKVGAWGQAIFCAEEVLLFVPNAWSAHAHLATLHYLSATSSTPPSLPSLSLSLKHFARSIELNTSYIRGFYGVKLLCRTILPILPASNTSTSLSKRDRDTEDDSSTTPLPSRDTLQKLEEVSTRRLGEIIREFVDATNKGGSGSGYDEAEIVAARELLDRE